MGKELNGFSPMPVAGPGNSPHLQKGGTVSGNDRLDNIKLGRHLLMKISLLGSFLRLPNIIRDEMTHRHEIEEEIIDFMGLSSFCLVFGGIWPMGVRKGSDTGPGPGQSHN